MKIINKKISVFGCGNMGEALVRGFVAKAVANPEQVFVCDSDESKIKELNSELGVLTLSDLTICLDSSDIVVLAVKPNTLREILKENSFSADSNKIIVSVAAGVQHFEIQKAFSGARVVRVMPNTPALIGEGVSGVFSDNVEAAKEISELFLSVGVAEVFEKEEDLDIVTGLSGSGPAYVFYFIESLVNGAVELGFSKENAKKLAVQTVIGAAKLVEKSNKEVSVLRENVCSPGGTTIEGIKALKEGSFEDVVKNAIRAASEKSRILSR